MRISKRHSPSAAVVLFALLSSCGDGSTDSPMHELTGATMGTLFNIKLVALGERRNPGEGEKRKRNAGTEGTPGWNSVGNQGVTPMVARYKKRNRVST